MVHGSWFIVHGSWASSYEDLLKDNGHAVNGYVVIPNHVHALISFINTKQSINTIIGNGKRFMAYEIIKRLQNQNETAILVTLQSNVEKTGKKNNKQQEVWKLFFLEGLQKQ